MKITGLLCFSKALKSALIMTFQVFELLWQVLSTLHILVLRHIMLQVLTYLFHSGVHHLSHSIVRASRVGNTISYLLSHVLKFIHPLNGCINSVQKLLIRLKYSGVSKKIKTEKKR